MSASNSTNPCWTKAAETLFEVSAAFFACCQNIQPEHPVLLFSKAPEGYGVGTEITWKMDKGGRDMSYSSLMHVAFHTDRMDEMVRFYTEVLGGKLKVVTRYGAYLERDDRPAMQAAARIRPMMYSTSMWNSHRVSSLSFFRRNQVRKRIPVSTNTWDIHTLPCVSRISAQPSGNWNRGDCPSTHPCPKDLRKPGRSGHMIRMATSLRSCSLLTDPGR